MFFANPVMRTVARMLFPSTKQAMIRDRSAVLKRFILTIMLERSRFVNSLLNQFSTAFSTRGCQFRLMATGYPAVYSK